MPLTYCVDLDKLKDHRRWAAAQGLDARVPVDLLDQAISEIEQRRALDANRSKGQKQRAKTGVRMDRKKGRVVGDES